MNDILQKNSYDVVWEQYTEGQTESLYDSN